MAVHCCLRLRRHKHQRLSFTDCKRSQRLTQGSFSSAGTSLQVLYLFCGAVIQSMTQASLSFFSLLYRRENLVFSLVLLIGCYSAILIPAYLPLDRVASLNDDYQQPKDLVWAHNLAIIFHHFFILTKLLSMFASLVRSY